VYVPLPAEQKHLVEYYESDDFKRALLHGWKLDA